MLPCASASASVSADDAGGLDLHRPMIAQRQRQNRRIADRRTARVARRPVAGAVHAPPLAEEAAAGPPGAARRGAAAGVAERCSRWPRATTSSRAWSCAAGGRWSAAPRAAAAARAAAASRRRLDRCWCRASTCTCRPRMRCCDRFRFVPDARLDDLMVSYRQRRRRRRPARRFATTCSCCRCRAAGAGASAACARPALRDDVPLKMLARLRARAEWLLEPGDMLYLPPGWAHDGIAVGADCMTARSAFAPRRRPTRRASCCSASPTSATDEPEGAPRRYRDRAQPATRSPAPHAARAAPLRRAMRCSASLRDPDARRPRARRSRSPSPSRGLVRRGGAVQRWPAGLVLDRRTRMLYDERHVFINGESLARGRPRCDADARLADQRRLPERAVAAASAAARELLGRLAAAGWLHASEEAVCMGRPRSTPAARLIGSRAASSHAAVRAAVAWRRAGTNASWVSSMSTSRPGRSTSARSCKALTHGPAAAAPPDAAGLRLRRGAAAASGVRRVAPHVVARAWPAARLRRSRHPRCPGCCSPARTACCWSTASTCAAAGCPTRTSVAHGSKWLTRFCNARSRPSRQRPWASRAYP